MRNSNHMRDIKHLYPMSLRLNELRQDYKRLLYIYIYIYCPTRTNISKSLIMLDNKKSPGAARFPVQQLEIYCCSCSNLAWYATIKTTEGNKNLMAVLPIRLQDFTLCCRTIDHVFVSGAMGLPVAPCAARRRATPRVCGGTCNHGSWHKNVVNLHSTMII